MTGNNINAGSSFYKFHEATRFHDIRDRRRFTRCFKFEFFNTTSETDHDLLLQGKHPKYELVLNKDRDFEAKELTRKWDLATKKEPLEIVPA
jgi:hypothetical protein